ncbi:hypothetical protein DFQ30_003361 [Apophysomyces sp. BC1015]|nr:hypothetical protein DFQ30_003361 [Apophysomyces sp. BC1015]
MIRDLQNLAISRPTLKNIIEATETDIKARMQQHCLLIAHPRESVIQTTKSADSVNNIKKIMQNNYPPTGSSLTASTFSTKREQAADLQPTMLANSHHKKQKGIRFQSSNSCAPSLSINKPTLNDIDAQLLIRHFYGNIADTTIAQGEHGSADAEAQYKRNMEDQSVKKSLQQVKCAYNFLKQALEQPLEKLLDFVWSYNIDTQATADYHQAIMMMRYIFTDYHANFLKPIPCTTTNE